MEKMERKYIPQNFKLKTIRKGKWKAKKAKKKKKIK
jgi:hypothetical protein